MADQPYVGRVPCLISSDGGNCYLRLVPDGQQGTAGSAVAYRVGRDCGGDQLLWRTDWADSSVVLSNDGHSLMRLLLTFPGEGGIEDPTIVSFYRDGQEFLSYRYSEIVTPADEFPMSNGRRPWCNGELHEWRDNGIEVVDLPLAQGRIVSFELHSGRVRSTTAGHAHSGREVVDTGRQTVWSLEPMGLAGAALVVGVVLGVVIRRLRAPSTRS